jgi:hypothetical protein
MILLFEISKNPDSMGTSVEKVSSAADLRKLKSYFFYDSRRNP